MRRALLLVVGIALASSGFAEIHYTVTPDTASSRLNFRVAFRVNSPTVDVQLPRWAPGSYRLYEPAISTPTASAGGNELAVTVVDPNTWRIDTGGAREIWVEYSAPYRMSGGTIHYTGPHNYVYVVGRKEEACTLRITGLPEGWRAINGLDERGDGWIAPDYDVLADNPTSVGEFHLDTYEVQGKPHHIVCYGNGKDLIDRQRLLKYCRDITVSQTAFFGDMPYNKYVWHFNVNPNMDGAGGLEHLSSTSITLAAGIGPRAVSVLSHEFFHLWNVKRIRSKPLGPFDYLNLPKTGALWWLEGVTDYYASLLLHRYGILPPAEMEAEVISQYASYERHPQKNNISPNESSMRVGETNNGRGNSNGYLMSYYNLGWIAGLCLDIEIRRLSGNKHSLDDVMRALYSLTRDDRPGFEEGEIRRQCIRYAGPEIGAFYGQVVHQNGSIPVVESLAKIGMDIEARDERFYDWGFTWQGIENGLAVRRAGNGLSRSDRIAAVGSTSLEGMNAIQAHRAAEQAFDRVPGGATVRLTIVNAEGTKTVDVAAELSVRNVQMLVATPGATKEQIALRNAVLGVRPMPSEQK